MVKAHSYVINVDLSLFISKIVLQLLMVEIWAANFILDSPSLPQQLQLLLTATLRSWVSSTPGETLL